MRDPIVAGNWKMHGRREFVETYIAELARSEALKHGSESMPEVVLFPPVAYLDCAARSLATNGLARRISLGAQNLHAEAAGAFTGETAGEMIVDLGARYVLVGHSERRQLFAESDAMVAAKFAAAVRAGLTPVLCVGETLAEREAGTEQQVVRQQLGAVLKNAGIRGGIVAYEPVWAIGTGRTAAPEQAQQMHQCIRSVLAQLDPLLADATRILYGGSVTADNAGALFAMPDIDGGLVGGASLQPQDFAAIVAAAGVGRRSNKELK